MRTQKKYDTDLVFGISRGIPLTYVHRAVDDIFLNNLKKDKHIVLFGCSKQGKTTIINKHLNKGEYVAINCERARTLNEIYTTLLKEANFEIEVQSEKSDQKGSDLKIEFKVLSFLGLSTAQNYENKNLVQRKRLEFDINHVHDVIKALNSVKFEKYLVIEDFHYLDEKVQEAFATHLKIFNERSSIMFIIIGVWSTEDYLARFNGDLNGRLCNINANNWSNDDLLQVINKGEELLNVRITEGTKEVLIESSFGSIAVLQLLCLDFCKKNGILNTQENCVDLGKTVHITEILSSWIDSQSLKYISFLRKLIEGDSVSSDVAKLIMLSLIDYDAELLKGGIFLKEIHEIIIKFQPGKSISLLNLEESIRRLKRVQLDSKRIPILFDYDEEKRVLHITDKFLFFGLANKHKPGAMEDLGIENELILRYKYNRY
jgi:hypothetical protein